MNQDKDTCMGGNYDGTYLALHMREDWANKSVVL
jgi:hypothetical protein